MQWQRFWIDPADTVHYGPDGYVIDPRSEHGKALNKSVLATPNVAEQRCLLLLGEPGIGKSHALRELHGMARESGTVTLVKDLGTYSSDQALAQGVFQDRTYQEWLRGDQRLALFLDAFDECKFHVLTAAKVLSEHLGACPSDRLSLRIVCRTADRPLLLENLLRTRWRDRFRVLELLPLTRSDIAAAAAEETVDPALFLVEVERMQLQSFASRPLTLQFLLREFRKHGRLPGSPAELYARGCLELCSEVNPSRIDSRAVGTLNAHESLRASELLAGVGVLAKTSRFALPPFSRARGQPDVLDLEELAEQIERNPVEGHSFSSQEQLEALGTGLFTGRGDGYLGWGHATYEAFLGARFLVEHLSIDQLKNVLLRPDASGNLRAIPQIQEVAVWAAALEQRIRDLLLKDDLETILKLTIVPLTDDEKQHAVTNLLRKVEEKQLFDIDVDRPIRYEQLNHPNLSGQVRQALLDRTKSLFVKRAALELADDCVLVDLSSTLAEVALDEAERSDTRQHAARVVGHIGDLRSREQLRPLLGTDRSQDPDDQLRGNALRALWKGGLLGKEVWRYCEAPRNEHLVGAYTMFLASELPAALQDREHVLAALEWALEHQKPSRDLAFGLRELQKKVLRTGWEHADDPAVMRALAEVAVARALRYEVPLGVTDLTLSQNPGRQLSLLKALVEVGVARGLTAGHLLGGRGSLLEGVTFPVLLRCAAVSEGSAAAVWARVARLHYGWTSADLEALLEQVPRSAALRAEFRAVLDPVELGSTSALQMRKEYEELEALRHTAVANSEEPEADTEAAFESQLRKHLEGVEVGDLDHFWRLNADMAFWNERDGYNERESDLEKLPVWTTVSETDRVRVVEAALRYVRDMKVKDDDALNGSHFHRPAAAGVRALVLLAHRSPGQLESLTRESWEAWAASLMAYGSHELELSDVDAGLLNRAYVASPMHAASMMQAVLEDRDKRTRHVYGVEQLVRCGDSALAGTLARWAIESNISPQSRSAVLAEALPRVPDAEPIVRYIADDSTPREDRLEVTSALLRTHAAQAWPVAWSIFKRDEPFAREALARAADGADQRLDATLAVQLKAREVVELHQMLAEWFPPEDDPEPRGVHLIGPPERLRWLRSGLLTALQKRGTHEAVEALREVARNSDAAWHHWLALQADRARIQSSWVGVKPAELLGMCVDKARRFVESDDQLVSVVVESLARLQRELCEETPAAEDLWNADTPKGEGHLSNYIKRHLARDLAGRRLIVNREVEVRPGSETDIRVQAVPRDRNEMPISITIEVKGCWNKSLKTAMRDQLLQKYMRPAGERAGIYLVGWYSCERWSREDYRRGDTPKWSALKAKTVFESQAQELRAEGVSIAAVVLECAAER